jgi:hypothetical protein
MTAFELPDSGFPLKYPFLPDSSTNLYTQQPLIPALPLPLQHAPDTREGLKGAPTYGLLPSSTSYKRHARSSTQHNIVQSIA